jgi:hypothetical protein
LIDKANPVYSGRTNRDKDKIKRVMQLKDPVYLGDFRIEAGAVDFDEVFASRAQSR